MNGAPSVSCLMASNRPDMMLESALHFTTRDYSNAILSVDTAEGLHGGKMDRLFKKADGEFLVVWDDDDLYAKDRISRLVQPMIDNPDLLCVGTSLVYYIDERIRKAWLYDNATVTLRNPSLFWIGAPAYRRR